MDKATCAEDKFRLRSEGPNSLGYLRNAEVGGDLHEFFNKSNLHGNKHNTPEFEALCNFTAEKYCMDSELKVHERLELYLTNGILYS